MHLALPLPLRLAQYMSLATIWFARACKFVKWIARLRREPLKFTSMCTILSHPCCWGDKPLKLSGYGAHLICELADSLVR